MKINNIKKIFVGFIKKWIFWIYILLVIIVFIYFYSIEINIIKAIIISVNSIIFIIFLSIMYYIRKFIYKNVKCKKFIEKLYIKYPIIFVIRYNLFNIPELMIFFWLYIYELYIERIINYYTRGHPYDIRFYPNWSLISKYKWLRNFGATIGCILKGSIMIIIRIILFIPNIYYQLFRSMDEMTIYEFIKSKIIYILFLNIIITIFTPFTRFNLIILYIILFYVCSILYKVIYGVIVGRNVELFKKMGYWGRLNYILQHNISLINSTNVQNYINSVISNRVSSLFFIKILKEFLGEKNFYDFEIYRFNSNNKYFLKWLKKIFLYFELNLKDYNEIMDYVDGHAFIPDELSKEGIEVTEKNIIKYFALKLLIFAFGAYIINEKMENLQWNLSEIEINTYENTKVRQKAELELPVIVSKKELNEFEEKYQVSIKEIFQVNLNSIIRYIEISAKFWEAVFTGMSFLLVYDYIMEFLNDYEKLKNYKIKIDFILDKKLQIKCIKNDFSDWIDQNYDKYK